MSFIHLLGNIYNCSIPHWLKPGRGPNSDVSGVNRNDWLREHAKPFIKVWEHSAQHHTLTNQENHNKAAVGVLQ